MTGKKWHSTSDIYNQYKKFFVRKDGKSLSYRRVFDILAEIEQAGLLGSDNESEGRYGYSKKYTLTVPVESVKILSEKMWENWSKFKEKRFEMLHNPEYNRKDFDGRLTKYEDLKKWNQIIGAD